MLSTRELAPDIDRAIRGLKTFAHKEENWIHPGMGQRPTPAHRMRWSLEETGGIPLNFTYAVEYAEGRMVRHLSIQFSAPDQMAAEDLQLVMEQLDPLMGTFVRAFFPLHNEVEAKWAVLRPVAIPLPGADPERPAVVYRTPVVFHVVVDHMKVPEMLGAELTVPQWLAQLEHMEEMLTAVWARVDELEEELRALRQPA